MQCPACGYALSPFDEQCPRCKNFADKGIQPLVRVIVPPEGAVDSSHLPSAAMAPMVLPPMPPERVYESLPTLPHGVLSCIVCGNDSTQKLSAIYQAGSYTEHTRSSSNSLAADLNGNVYDAVTSTSARTFGVTGIAQTLAPPPRPSCSRVNGCGLYFCIVLAFLGFFLSRAVGFGGFWTFIMFIGVVSAATVLILHATELQAAKDRLPYWRHSMERWEMLFYCSRCDHVFNPHTQSFSPSKAVQSML